MADDTLPDDRPGHCGWTWLALIGLALFVLVSRFAFLTSSTDMWDSCAYVDNVRKMIDTGTPLLFYTLETGHPLYLQLCALVVVVVQWSGGPDDVLFGIKVAGILCVASSVWPMCWLARRLLRSEGLGLLATAFYTLVPLLWWWSGEIMSDAAGTAILVWTFGVLARWTASGAIRTLIAAGLVLGAAPLIRFSNVSVIPVFLLVVLVRLRMERRWRPALALAAIPLPVVIWLVWGMALMPWRSAAEFLAMTPANAIEWDRTLSAKRWIEIGGMIVHALGVAGVVAAVGGLIVAASRHRVLFALSLLWIGCVVATQVGLYMTMIRYWLPLVPVAAVLMAAGVGVMRRWPYGAQLAPAAAGALATLLAVQAVPELRILHGRTNAMDAVAAWYAENTAPGSLIVGEASMQHVKTLTRDRHTLVCIPGAYEWPFLAGKAAAMPETIWRIDAAMAEHRGVYFSDLLDYKTVTALKKHYRAIEVGRLDGRRLRNVFDTGFVTMGEKMARTRDVVVFQLLFEDLWPRACPSPKVSVRRGLGGVTVTLDVDCPLAPGWYCAGFLAERPGALDWTSKTFKQDRLLKACLASVRQNVFRLDEHGRGRITMTVPALEGPPPDKLYAAYCVLDDAETPRRYSPAVEAK